MDAASDIRDLPPVARDLPEIDWLTHEDAAQRGVSYWDSSALDAAALARPASTQEVAAILRACHAAGKSVVTHGGRTTCVDGVRTLPDQIALSLEKMNAIIDVDPVEGTATVEAGVVLQTLQEAAEKAGVYFPLDLGARGSCTIGGNAATNAGGVNVLRYGMMRNLVLGLEAVLADGTVISSMNRMLKNNAGYDLKQLFIGTEGTLGVITQLVLRLEPLPGQLHTAMVAVADFAGIMHLLMEARVRLGTALHAFELMWGSYYDAVTRPGGHPPPLDRGAPFYLLIEASGNEGGTALEAYLEFAFAEGLVIGGTLAQSLTQRQQLWTVRDDFEAILKDGRTFLYDVSLPLRAMERYVAEVTERFSKAFPQGVVHVFGHICDGNLHIFLSPHPAENAPSSAQGWKEHRRSADAAVYEPLRAVGGSVSAEHGIGREKRDWLQISRTAEEIALMRTLKSSLDPRNILNPGLVIDVDRDSAS